MTAILNFSAFTRTPFINLRTGTLTREAASAMVTTEERIGGTTGGIPASEIVNTPNGGIAAVTVQSALDELDAEKQPLDATLTAVAGVTTAADKLIYWTGVDVAAVTDFTAFARTLVDDADAATMRTTLGLVIGTNVQAYDADLTTWAGKTAPSGTVVGTSDSQTLTNKTLTAPVINNPTGTMTLASGALGYEAGNGGTVTQSTNKATGVTLDKPSGAITMNNAALNAGVTVSFTLTNSTIAAGDALILGYSGGTAGGYRLNFECSLGSASISVTNTTGGSLSEAIVISFAVFKAATS